MKYLLFSLWLLIAVPVSAQTLTPSSHPLLTAAEWTFFAAGRADAGVTYRCQVTRMCIEADPPYAHMSPPTLQVASVAVDAATTILIAKTIGKHHPKLAAVVLFSLASLRINATIQGVRLLHH